MPSSIQPTIALQSTRAIDFSEHDFNDVDEELDEEEASVEDEDYFDYEYTDKKAWVDATTQWFSLTSYNFDCFKQQSLNVLGKIF